MGIDPTICKLIVVAFNFTVEQVSTGTSLLITQPLQGIPWMINKIALPHLKSREKCLFCKPFIQSSCLGYLVGGHGEPVCTVFMNGD